MAIEDRPHAVGGAKGRVLLMLHGHLPYVRHPEHEYFLEEDWLFEAITECYLPLLRNLSQWKKDRFRQAITLSLSPTLMEMLADELLQKRYLRYLEQRIRLAEDECQRLQGQPQLLKLAELYRGRFQQSKADFENYQGNLLARFSQLRAEGGLELCTTAASHGFLPLLRHSPGLLKAQISQGVAAFEEHMGFHPPGFWLPECGYEPGIDDLLAESGLTYTFLESYGLHQATPPADAGTYRPVLTQGGLMVMGRDATASQQVWSADGGYPGDRRYREFHRDIGFDLDFDHLKAYLPEGVRKHLGLKYYRVTDRRGELKDKELYNPEEALEVLEQHAEHFVQQSANRINQAAQMMAQKPLLVVPFDAELFGHWWFEGPEFLDLVVRKIRQHPDLDLTTPSKLLQAGELMQVLEPAPSTWGERSDARVWCNEHNDWIWPRLHAAADSMSFCVKNYPEPSETVERVLRQMGRELLLASASDWPFMLTGRQTESYAEKRVRTHLDRFDGLQGMLEEGSIDCQQLSQWEEMTPFLAKIDYRSFLKGA